MIMNGNITASRSSYGSGIGSGDGSYGNPTVLNLTIRKGNITASSPNRGAGIGGGRGRTGGKSPIETLFIMGGRITANGTLGGIGSGGEGGEVRLLRITGNAVLTCDADLTKSPINASSIVLTDASLVFTTPRNRLFGVSPSSSGLLNSVIVSGNVTTQGSEPLSNLNATFLQIGNITVPLSNDRTICISGSGYEHCYPTRSAVMKSLIVTVPHEGNYSIEVVTDAVSGRLETTEHVSSFVVSSRNPFLAEAVFIPVATATPHASVSLPATLTGSFSISLQSRPSSRNTLLHRFGCFLFVASVLI
jgi:hypothetical protein